MIMFLYVFCRCRYPEERDSEIPNSCIQFYDFEDFNVMYYDGGVIPYLKEILNYTIFEVYSNASSDLIQCANLIGNYLCHFYFPVCQMNDRGIHPICSTTCNLLFNNEECSSLLINAINLIATYNITTVPDNDSCVTTYRSYAMSDQPDSISNFCFTSEG